MKEIDIIDAFQKVEALKKYRNQLSDLKKTNASCSINLRTSQTNIMVCTFDVTIRNEDFCKMVKAMTMEHLESKIKSIEKELEEL